MTPPEKGGNLFRAVSASLRGEQVDVLAETPRLRIERIISRGQVTAPGQWYDEDRDEWVAVLAGAARLRFESESAPRALAPGDWLRIPAHARHRVEWTDPERATVWLAVHFAPGD